MVIWSVAHGAWQITFSRFITSEISGPGDGLLNAAATLATVAALALIGCLWWRAWRSGRTIPASTLGWIMLACTTLLVVTNKVFSPQYLMWIGPLAVATVACSPRRDRGVRRWTVILIVVGFVTQIVYPNAYVLVAAMSWGNPIGVGLLVVRDAGLLGLTWYACRRAWHETAAPG
jgi:hypothetical protein